MIEVHNLLKKYGDFTAVDRISFTAKKGEIVGLLGPNGAGKTTTMRILTGFMPPTAGTARVAGYDVTTDSIAARQSVGYLPERVPLYPDMTVEAYVAYWAQLRGVRRSKAQVEAVLKRVQLHDRRRTLIRNLSKGMRQRLGLAQALVHQPPVLILDEPTIGIDPQQVIEVRQLVREFGSEHTVLFSTHILSEAEQVCDRVLIINQGQIVAQGKPSALRQQFEPGEHLFVALEGGRGDAAALLREVAAVASVTAVEGGFQVRIKPKHDGRRAIFDAAVRAGWRLTEIRAATSSLEDVFLELVERDTAGGTRK